MRFSRSWALSLALVMWGCSQPEPKTPEYQVQGTLMAVEPDGTTINVDHEDIPGFMPAMTMDFKLASSDLLGTATPGDRIEMTLQAGGDWKITALRVVSKGTAPPTPDLRAGVEPPPREALPNERYFQVGVGQSVPVFRLIDQTGQPLSSADLKGKAVVLTFIYTRCPMPDFCPLITQRVLDLQRTIPPEIKDRVHFLMVSIDPKYDTPQILDQYARKHGIDLTTTSMLTGPIRPIALLSSYFGQEFWDQRDGTINHKLRLIVLDPQGRLHAELHGNTWTTARVLELLRQALAEPLRGTTTPQGSTPQ